MRRNLSDKEFHALYCPVKNPKSAFFLVISFSVVASAGWRGLHKPPEHPDLVVLIFAIIIVAFLAKWLVSFTCFRERLVLSIAIFNLVTGEIESFVPSVFDRHTEIVKSVKLALELLALVVSLTMLVQAARTPQAGRNELDEASTGRESRRNSLIMLAVLATILGLGSLLYFLPPRR